MNGIYIHIYIHTALLGTAGAFPQSVGILNFLLAFCEREKKGLSRQDSKIGFIKLLMIGQTWINIAIYLFYN